MPILSANRIGVVERPKTSFWEHPLWSGCFSYVQYNMIPILIQVENSLATKNRFCYACVTYLGAVLELVL
jgi:hypothetical protein